MIEALAQLSEWIKTYRRIEISPENGMRLNECLQQIVSIIAYLENELSDFHKEYHEKVQGGIKNELSVARAEHEANLSVPQLHKLRHVLKGAYEVAGAIRTNISFLKSEMNNL